jgi:predicted DNA-binding protein
MAKSTPVRIDDEVYEKLKGISKLHGVSTATVINNGLFNLIEQGVESFVRNTVKSGANNDKD